MRKVEAAAERTANTLPPEVVLVPAQRRQGIPAVRTVAQGSGYRTEGDAAAHGEGAVYWLQGSKRYGFRYPVSVEEILDVEPVQAAGPTPSCAESRCAIAGPRSP